MIIPITFNSSTKWPKLPPALAKISHDEVVLIELQGSLEVELNHPSERNGQLVGNLTIDEAATKPTLTIGHHLLEGKIVSLPKALAVLQRSETASEPVSASADMMDCDSETQDKAPDTRVVEWNAVAIVKRKIMFSKRPMPVVGRTG